MTQCSEKQEQLIQLKVAQLERVGSILFFLIPLVILLVVGKTFAFNILYLWQGYSLLYIVVYRLLLRKLSPKQVQLKLPRGWEYNRFYRLCWGYLVLSIIIMAVYSMG